MTQPRTREELYEYIRQQGGRESFIAEQMIRLGFWKSSDLPSDPVEEIKRIKDLKEQLHQIHHENRKLFNDRALLKELRKRRLAESKQKQKETKERRELERRTRAENWKNRKEREILYLGEKVSGGLNNFEENAAKLQEFDLPSFSDIEKLAQAMKLSVGKLRFLAFHRQTAENTHYIHFQLPKKSGGFRLISAPMPFLKSAQHWILENILYKIPIHSAAHGFVKEKNIVSNAKPHVGSQLVINFDLQDFFPSINYPRVKGIFRSFGYSEAISTVFALICTAPDVEQVEIDGKTYFVAIGERHLPQGAPTSPAISNLIARSLDKGLTKIAEKFGFSYTRYADDLTFSAQKSVDWKNEEEVFVFKKFLSELRFAIEKQNLKINENKTRILRRGRQQEVTGIVVNDKISIDRKTLRKFRAVLHQAETKGLEGLVWGNSQDLLASLDGFANFVLMVDSQKGKSFKEKIIRIAEKYDRKISKKNKSTPHELRHKQSEIKSEKPEQKPKDWWKIW